MAYQKIGFKNGNVLTAEQLIHMEDGIIDAEKKAQAGGTGTGLPSGGEPYMQLVTDGEGKAGWEQRLAWKEESMVELFPEQTLEFSEDSDGVFTCAMETNVTLENGKTYTVMWDGTEYKCVAKVDSYGDLCIGNVAVWGETPDTGEPFVLYPNSEGEDYFNTLSTEQTHTISITTVSDITHKLPDEFLKPVADKKTIFAPESRTVKYISYLGYGCELSFVGGLNISAGSKYVAIIDDNKYELVADELSYHGIFIGNPSVVDSEMESNGLPFAFVQFFNGWAIKFEDDSWSGVHYIGLAEPNGTIDNDYLPESLRFGKEYVSLCYISDTNNATLYSMHSEKVDQYLDTKKPKKLMFVLNDSQIFELTYVEPADADEKPKWNYDGYNPQIEWEDANNCYSIRLDRYTSGSVQLIVPELNKLKPEYLPVTRIVFTYDGTDYICNVPYEEFDAAVMSGMPMVYVDVANSQVTTWVTLSGASGTWNINAHLSTSSVVTMVYTSSGLSAGGAPPS